MIPFTVKPGDVSGLGRRQRLPDSYLAQHRRKRIMTALAKCLAESDYRYQDTKVADIVRTSRSARNTFYDAFAGKDAVAHALISDAWPSLGALFGPGDIDATGAGALAVELAAARIHDPHRYAAVRAAGLGLRDLLAEGIPTWPAAAAGVDPYLCKLPPGRHCLPRQFVRENQRRRLLTGYAAAIAEHGNQLVTIADVVSKAQVSRRTFYEHFGDKRDLDPLLLEAAPDIAARLGELAPASPGLVSLTLDILGAALAGDGIAAAGRLQIGSAVLDGGGEG